jgi:hypothetical protein
VVLVDLGLEPVADGEQLAVARRELLDQARQPIPEGISRYAGIGQRLALDEFMKNRGDLEAVRLDARHRSRFRWI